MSKERISELSLKYRNNNLSKDEENELTKWFVKSDFNKVLFTKIINLRLSERDKRPEYDIILEIIDDSCKDDTANKESFP